LRSSPDFLVFDLGDAAKTLKNLLFRECPVFVNCVKPEVLLFFPVSLEHSAPVTRSNVKSRKRRGTASTQELGGEPSQSRQDEARMRTKSRNRGLGPVLAVLTLVAAMPELARAQQSGLFPNAPIKRQRVPCDQEDPVYKIYKEKYFGYHPTCWRPFPTGWGCPSPEKPDVEKSFREQKLGTSEGMQTDAASPLDAQEGDQPVVPRPSLPTPPGGRQVSPFEQLGPEGDKPANPPAPRQDQKPPADIFDSPDKPPADAPNAPRAGRTRPASPPVGDPGPELSAPEQPARLGGARTSRLAPAEEADTREDDGPLLSTLPNVSLPPVGTTPAGAPFGTQVAQGDTMNADAATTQTTPANSAPRRGFLSGLFNNLGLNWTRR
jgi:hypothetical protein